MLEQIGNNRNTVELERHFSELVLNGFTLIKDVETEDIDGIYEFFGEKDEIIDKRVFQETIANRNISFTGWREVKTKCFTTADLRNPRIIISPHCESNPRGGSFQATFFYCKKPAEIGGDNVLVPSENVSDGLRFKKSIFIPVPSRLCQWHAFLKIVQHTFPFMKKMSNFYQPLLFLLFLIFFVNNIIPIILRIFDVEFVLGPIIESGIPIIRFSKFKKHLKLEEGLNGNNYRTLGFTEGFYDRGVLENFREFIIKNNLYSATVSESDAYVNKSEEFRYKPLYHSHNDFSKLFDDSVILKLKKDELVIIDNRRYMHSSLQYVGDRQMYAAFL